MSQPLRFVAIWFIAFAVVARCTVALAQTISGEGRNPEPRLFASPQPIVVLYVRLTALPTVDKELNLTKDQRTKFKVARDKIQAVLAEPLGGTDGQRKTEETANKMNSLVEELKKTLESTLSPEKLERLKGIALQVAGILALGDKEIQRDLALSNDQVAKINAADADVTNKFHEMLRQLWHSTDPKIERSKMQELLVDYEKQVMDVLTVNQKSLFEKMRGAEIPGLEKIRKVSWD
jgi:hypothetical protein